MERAREIGCEAVQIFVKSPQQWRGARLEGAEVEAFRAARQATGVGPVVAHAAYLINLAAPDQGVLSRSRRGLADELARCGRLGVDALVVHPGAHLGAGVERGLGRAAASLREVLARTQPGARLLVENTAGQGTVLGAELEQLAALLERVAAPERLGLCIDTCHAFAAGYSLDRSAAYRRFWERLDALAGLTAIGCLHLNDSAHARGSRRDRHANLGEGEIGDALFRRLVRDPALAALPMILETPRGADGRGHARDLAKLRRWRAGARAAGPRSE